MAADPFESSELELKEKRATGGDESSRSEEVKHESGDLPPPACRARLSRWLRIALRTGIAIAAIAPTATLLDWPAGTMAEPVLAGVAVFLLLFHCVNTRTRIRLLHWRTSRLVGILRSELVIGWGMPIFVIVMALLLPPSWPALLGIGVAFGISYALYEPIEEKIRELVTAEDLQQGTDFFGRRRPFRFIGIEESIRELAERDHGPNLQFILSVWIKDPWRPGLSRTRSAILYMMLASFCMAWYAAGDVIVRDSNQNHGRRGEQSREHQPQPATGETDTARPTDEKETPVDVVGEACPSMPSLGAPLWARENLDALYYGGKQLHATTPPGNLGGCTGRAIVPAAENGTFVYTIGRNDQGEIRSVAVDSLTFGPAIFLAPSAQRVLALIHRGIMPVGGFPSLNVAGGDMATARTEQGVFAFVRGAKHQVGLPDIAEPYVELPPAAASAWVGAMNERAEWLWPLPPHFGGESVEFPLASWRGDEAELTIHYEPRDGTAERDQYAYSPPMPELSERRLKDLALTAR